MVITGLRRQLLKQRLEDKAILEDTTPLAFADGTTSTDENQLYAEALTAKSSMVASFRTMDTMGGFDLYSEASGLGTAFKDIVIKIFRSFIKLCSLIYEKATALYNYLVKHANHTHASGKVIDELVDEIVFYLSKNLGPDKISKDLANKLKAKLKSSSRIDPAGLSDPILVDSLEYFRKEVVADSDAWKSFINDKFASLIKQTPLKVLDNMKDVVTDLISKDTAISNIVDTSDVLAHAFGAINKDLDRITETTSLDILGKSLARVGIDVLSGTKRAFDFMTTNNMIDVARTVNDMYVNDIIRVNNMVNLAGVSESFSNISATTPAEIIALLKKASDSINSNTQKDDLTVSMESGNKVKTTLVNSDSNEVFKVLLEVYEWNKPTTVKTKVLSRLAKIDDGGIRSALKKLVDNRNASQKVTEDAIDNITKVIAQTDRIENILLEKQKSYFGPDKDNIDLNLEAIRLIRTVALNGVMTIMKLVMHLSNGVFVGVEYTAVTIKQLDSIVQDMDYIVYSALMHTVIGYTAKMAQLDKERGGQE